MLGVQVAVMKPLAATPVGRCVSSRLPASHDVRGSLRLFVRFPGKVCLGFAQIESVFVCRACARFVGRPRVARLSALPQSLVARLPAHGAQPGELRQPAPHK